MKFKELEYFQDASFCFIQDDKFKRKLMPDQEQYDYFLKNMSHERCTVVDNLASLALSGFFFNAEHRFVSGLFNLISDFGESSFEINKREGRSVNISFHLPVSVARTYFLGVPPDAEIVKAGLSQTVARFQKERRTTSHVSDIRELIDAIFSSFLAHDLESAEELLSVRKNVKTFPFMDSLAREMLKCATYETVANKKIIRFHSDSVKSNFVKLLDAHRDWTRKRFMQTYPNEYCCYLAEPFLASYCLAWIYLQSFAPEPIFHVSKADMRLILTDTTAQ